MTSPITLEPGRRQTLADQLYGQILDQIVSGSLREGDKLPSEQRICQSFQVSRPTVRAALLRLHADGLVTTRQGAGTFVRSRPSGHLTRLADSADIAALLRGLEVRMGLEAQAAALAAQRRSAAELHAITAALAELRAAFAANRNPAAADFAFHRAVAKATGNALFADLLDQLQDPIHRAMTVALGITRAGSADRARRVLEEHEAIADAIAQSDPQAAELAMRYHLTRSRQRVTDGQRDV